MDGAGERGRAGDVGAVGGGGDFDQIDGGGLERERARDRERADRGAGRSVPPLMSVVPTVPVPPSVAPLLTVVRLDEAVEPCTSSVPAFTVVAPV